MRGSGDGVMEAGGVVVKATCPENTTCRRLQAANNVISVASKETPRRLRHGGTVGPGVAGAGDVPRGARAPGNDGSHGC
eukprot:Skav231691  [mRNA]  locus=scaffold597:1074468:1076481:+ [translate_table: standard]